jgi:hypothetical protein
MRERGKTMQAPRCCISAFIHREALRAPQDEILEVSRREDEGLFISIAVARIVIGKKWNTATRETFAWVPATRRDQC